MNISCFGDVSGYEEIYLKGLININPSEAILMNRALKAGGGEDPYKSVLSFKKEIPKVKDKNIQLFDSKIASLNWSKEKAAENEDYQEAEKLKQIITKIEKLKSHIRSLESKKNQYALEENYEKAKRMKNEINRVVTVVMNINSRSQTQEKNPLAYKIQSKLMFDRHQKGLNRSLYDETYSNQNMLQEKISSVSVNQSMAAYGDSLKNKSLTGAEEDLGMGNPQRSVKNLKNLVQPKRAGILKYNTNFSF